MLQLNKLILYICGHQTVCWSFIRSSFLNLAAQLSLESPQSPVFRMSVGERDSPDVIGPEGNLQLSQDLSGFLHASLKLTEHMKRRYRGQQTVNYSENTTRCQNSPVFWFSEDLIINHDRNKELCVSRMYVCVTVCIRSSDEGLSTERLLSLNVIADSIILMCGCCVFTLPGGI